MKKRLAILFSVLLLLVAASGAADELLRAVKVEAESDDHHLTHEFVVKQSEGDEPQVFFLQGGGELHPGLVKVRSLQVAGGFLGVHLVELTPELRSHFGVDPETGVMVSQVSEDSPAARAGIQVGDIVTGAAGGRVASGHDLRRFVRATEDGGLLEVEIVRDGQALVFTPEIELRPGPVRLEPGLRALRLDLQGCDEDEKDCELEWHCDQGDCLRQFESGVLEESMERLHELIESGELPFGVHEADRSLEKRIQQLERRLERMAREIEQQEDELEESGRD